MLCACVAASPAEAETQDPRVGLRAGLGTDVNLGLAFGVGGNYLVPLQKNSVELGVVMFGGSFDETSDNGFNVYEEETSIFVFGLMANYMFNYTPYQSGTFFIAGFGLASVSMDWEERSTTDESLGTPLPGGGSMQSEDGSGGGTVFNLGIGQSFQNGMDLRAELPVIVSFSAPGEASAVVPTFIFTLGYRF
jgi:hypothetical protein